MKTPVLEVLDPTLAGLLAASNGEIFPPASEQSPDELRHNVEAYVQTLWTGIPLEPVAAIQDLVIPSGTHDVPVRIYTPPNPRATIVYFHGGGYVAGSIDTHDRMTRRLANGAHARVVSVDYRLAPEHPYPAGLDDCMTATQWSADQFNGTPVLVAGDSAGGTLSIAVTLRTRDTGGPSIAGQVLIYPAIDHSGSTESRQRFASGYGLTQADMQYYSDVYLPDMRIRADDPYADLFGRHDLHDLPPALVTTAGFDPLRDEGAEYATRLIQSGVSTTYRPEPSLVHGYIDLVPIDLAALVPAANEARNHIIDWIDRMIADLHTTA